MTDENTDAMTWALLAERCRIPEGMGFCHKCWAVAKLTTLPDEREYCETCAARIVKDYGYECALCGALALVKHGGAKGWKGEAGTIALCVDCGTKSNRTERGKLITELARAKKHGLPATLTMKEWLGAIDYFGGLCAYCQERPAAVIEHFMPVDCGGGTTAANCVPACRKCNGGKHAKLPKTLPRKTFKRIAVYFKLRSGAV